MSSLNYLIVGIIPGILCIAAFFLISLITPYTKRSKTALLQERTAYNPNGVENVKFKRLLRETTNGGFEHTSAERYVSIIIPAMNEEERLPIMLEECLAYLTKRAEESDEFTFEIIVVDDGSTDETSKIAFSFSKDLKKGELYVLKLPQNVGKGGAVRYGVLCARGEIILFADADGATKFSDFGKLETALRDLSSDGEYFECDAPALALGSRAHLEKESTAKRSIFRTILMKGFHIVVWIFTVRTVKDTQCGFKMFTRGAAATLFPKMHIERWAFDVELLYLAEKAKMPIAEVAVQWKEVDGSKITPVLSWIQMGRDIFLIWFRYSFRIWEADDLIQY
uniref:dolichyl-phosphate beta-glucosyltransferase n=1 Tax=Panagrolaimus superbus TaxID=310955 RepID=A0A914Z3M5_9BILA